MRTITSEDRNQRLAGFTNPVSHSGAKNIGGNQSFFTALAAPIWVPVLEHVSLDRYRFIKVGATANIPNNPKRKQPAARQCDDGSPINVPALLTRRSKI